MSAPQHTKELTVNSAGYEWSHCPAEVAAINYRRSTRKMFVVSHAPRGRVTRLPVNRVPASAGESGDQDMALGWTSGCRCRELIHVHTSYPVCWISWAPGRYGPLPGPRLWPPSLISLYFGETFPRMMKARCPGAVQPGLHAQS